MPVFSRPFPFLTLQPTAAAAAAAAPLTTAATATASASSSSVLISQLLGSVVSVGSAAVKIPQLLNIIHKNSVQGLSLSMYGLEIFTQSIAIYYHYLHQYSLSTYGENVSLGLGNVAILLYYFKLKKDFTSLCYLCSPVLLSSLLRFPAILDFLQSLSIPLNIAAKFPQIYLNYQNQSTGNLAYLPFLLNFLGSASRLYTTKNLLNNDIIMQIGFLSSCCLNMTIVLQVFYYRWKNRHIQTDKQRQE